MLTLNAKLKERDGSECQTGGNNGSKRQTKDVALNAKLKNGSECQTKNTTLNVKLKTQL